MILSVDIVSMFLTSEITSDIQKHNFLENINVKEEPEKIIKKKRKELKWRNQDYSTSSERKETPC